MDNIQINNENEKVTNSKSKKWILIGMGVIAVIILFVIIVNKTVYTTISIEDMCKIDYEGINGKAVASVQINEIYFDSIINNKYEDYIWDFAYTAYADISPNTELSNGSEVTVTLNYDKELAKKAHIKVKSDTQTFTVEGLPVPEDLDPFENLQLIYDGTSPFGTVRCDTSNCNDFVKKYVSLNAENPRDYVKNGDTVKIIASYYEGDADEQLVNITKTEQEYTVSGMPEYIKDVEGLDLSLLEQSLSDKVLEIVNKAKNQTVIFGMAYFASTYFDVSDKFTFSDLKTTGRYIAYAKNDTYHYSGFNSIYTLYEITATETNGTKHNFYFYLKADDVVKQTDGSLSWGNISVNCKDESAALVNEINAKKSEYDFTEVDYSTVIVPQI